MVTGYCAEGGALVGGELGFIPGAVIGGVAAGAACAIIGAGLTWYICQDLGDQITEPLCGEYLCSGFCCQANGGVPLRYCAGACVDAQTDMAHCGTCGNSCPEDAVCIGGQCKRCSQVVCEKPAGSQPDPEQNCQCVCPPGTEDCCDVCVVSGQCCGCVSCPPPRVCCDATTNLCTDLMTDVHNCGACGATCAGTDSCVNGQCVSASACPPGCTSDCCPPGWVLYDELCVDPTFTCQINPCTDADCCQTTC